MDIILFGGNSLKNKKWVEDVRDKLKDIFDSVEVHYYKHWESGEDLIDIDKEIEIVYDKMKSRKNYMVFAKSAGVALAIKAINEGKINPNKCIFFGTPILWTRDVGIPLEQWMKNFKKESLFVQNEKDPAINAEDLARILRNKVKNYKLKILKGDTHEYLDLEQIKKIIVELKGKD